MSTTAPFPIRLWIVVLALPLFCAVVWPVGFASAHELLPSEVVELLRENPNLTEDDIEAYVMERDKNATVLANASTIAAAKNENATVFDVIANFIALGIRHILEGLDHVLFVLSLLLVFINLRHVLKLVSAFTIAHTVTFLIAGLGLFTLPPRVIEPLIALSIAYVTITTVFFQRARWMRTEWSKIGGVFFFGLFHGLGFAGLLTDLAIPEGKFLLSLISFNVGIEIGQLIILGLALPYIYLFRRQSWYPLFIKASAVVISQIALLWTVERVLGIQIL